MMNLRVDELDEQYSGDADGDDVADYSWFVEEEKEVIDETESEEDPEEEDEEDDDEEEEKFNISESED